MTNYEYSFDEDQELQPLVEAKAEEINEDDNSDNISLEPMPDTVPVFHVDYVRDKETGIAYRDFTNELREAVRAIFVTYTDKNGKKITERARAKHKKLWPQEYELVEAKFKNDPHYREIEAMRPKKAEEKKPEDTRKVPYFRDVAFYELPASNLMRTVGQIAKEGFAGKQLWITYKTQSGYTLNFHATEEHKAQFPEEYNTFVSKRDKNIALFAAPIDKSTNQPSFVKPQVKTSVDKNPLMQNYPHFDAQTAMINGTRQLNPFRLSPTRDQVLFTWEGMGTRPARQEDRAKFVHDWMRFEGQFSENTPLVLLLVEGEILSTVDALTKSDLGSIEIVAQQSTASEINNQKEKGSEFLPASLEKYGPNTDDLIMLCRNYIRNRNDYKSVTR